MRKMKLDVQELTVESFATGEGGGRAGTVKARADGRAEHSPGFGHGHDGEEGGIAGITGTCICTLTCPVATRCDTCVNTCTA